jgi:large subunit ribosomal protein L20
VALRALPPPQAEARLPRALDRAGVALDRKILSDLAISDPAAFKKVVETAAA